MTFHIVSLPHTQTTHYYDNCAYTAKVRKFCDMMFGLGHEVILYAGENNDAACTELVTIITKEKQREFFGEQGREEFFNIKWDLEAEPWRYTNKRAIEEIGKRIKPKDFICIIGGLCQEEIAKAFPEHMSVEYGIGYTGTFSKYRVFESYPHLHYVHGFQQDDNGNFYDTVIPNYYDPEEFPFAVDRDDYYLFVGRIVERKGYRIAQEVCEKLGKRLLVAGQGGLTGYGEYLGVIDAKQRGELMSKAQALFVPTTYIEPFGGVHAEANLCGTPVITTNFGVFTQTINNGFNGYRCDNFQEFLNATNKVSTMGVSDRMRIREWAQGQYSMDKVAVMYDNYFKRLLKLWGAGWYELDATT